MGKTYKCGVSLEKAQLLEPGLDVRLIVGGEGLGDGGIGAQLGEDVQAVVDGIAGAGAEGDNGLARKVVGLQEGGNHGGGLLPPYCVSKLIQSTSCGYRFLICKTTTRYALFHSSPRTHMVLGIVF